MNGHTPLLPQLCHQFRARRTRADEHQQFSVSLLWSARERAVDLMFPCWPMTIKVLQRKATIVNPVKMHYFLMESLYAQDFPNTNPLFPSFFLHSPLLSPPQIPVQFPPNT